VKLPAQNSVLPSVVELGREICCDLAAAESREWLVTNGIGGYGFGTVAGHLTRSYHGLLVAALEPPLGRVLLLAKLDESVEYGGQKFDLATNRWTGGAISPAGFVNIERFRLEGSIPVWTYALTDALLEKRIFMQPGAAARAPKRRPVSPNSDTRQQGFQPACDEASNQPLNAKRKRD